MTLFQYLAVKSYLQCNICCKFLTGYESQINYNSLTFFSKISCMKHSISEWGVI